jgi:DNA-binding NarL/FixJ family response regulator
VTLRLLVVDDLAEIRTVLRISLPLLNRQLRVVAEAANPQEAARLAADHKPDVIVLDTRLPDPVGRPTFEQLRTVAPESKVVVYSAAESDQSWYTSRGAPFVEKGSDLHTLAETIVRHAAVEG